MSKGLECFFGTDVWSGSTRMFVPGLFAAELYRDVTGDPELKIILDEKVLDMMSQAIIQNTLPYREAILSHGINKHYVSKKVVDKINKYVRQGKIEKAHKKISGYSRARLMAYLNQSYNILEEAGDLVVGNIEKRETEPIIAYCYPQGGRRVFNIPDNLFAILEKDGELKINLQPTFLREDAKVNLEILKDNSNVKKFTVSRGELDVLTAACFYGEKSTSKKIIKDMINTALISLNRSNGN